MTNKEIKNIKFNSSDISKLYFGDLLVWQREGSNKPVGIWKISGTTEAGNQKYVKRYNNIAITDNNLSNEDGTFERNFNEEATNMQNMFSWCSGLTSLDVSNFDTSNVTSMLSMFEGCRGLTSLDVSNFDTANVTNMGSMFESCSGLTSLDVSNFDTSNVTRMNFMFNDCIGLASLNFGNFDTANVIAIYDMFTRCIELTNVTGVFEGTKEDLDLCYSPLLNSSAMVFINGLATVKETKTITFKDSTYDALTPEQIAVATSKGWTVVRSA